MHQEVNFFFGREQEGWRGFYVQVSQRFGILEVPTLEGNFSCLGLASYAGGLGCGGFGATWL